MFMYSDMEYNVVVDSAFLIVSFLLPTALCKEKGLW